MAQDRPENLTGHPTEPAGWGAAIVRFLQTQFGMFVLSSTVVPLLVFGYHTWRDWHNDQLTDEKEWRIIVHRVDTALHALGQADYYHVRRAFDTLQGDAEGYYQPIYPDLEKNVPLAGLILRIIPEDEVLDKKLPEPIAVLRELVTELVGVVGPDAPKWEFDTRYPPAAPRIEKLRKQLDETYNRFRDERD